MKILVFSDLHGDRAALSALLDREADLYVAAGDLVNWGRDLDRMGELLARKAGRVLVLPGNHESAAQTRACCQRHGLLDFHERRFQAGPWHVAGLGYSSPTPFSTPGEYSEEQLAERLGAFAGLSPLVMICHAPPADTRLDEAAPGRHYGSTAVREFIDAHQPDWFLCGHIHEAWGRQDLIGRTRAVNAGRNGYLLELDGVAPGEPLKWF